MWDDNVTVCHGPAGNYIVLPIFGCSHGGSAIPQQGVTVEERDDGSG